MLSGSGDCLSEATDSILIRKSRLRRIISGGKLHTVETSDFKEQNEEGSKKKVSRGRRGSGDVVAGATFSYPVSTWNLDEECLLDAFLVLFDEVENHSNKDINAQFFISKFEPVVQQVKKMRVNMKDFQVGKLLSQGSFSSVHVVKEKTNKRVFVMKSINKFHTNVEQRLYLRDAELSVLSKHATQWIVGFHYAFQDTEKIHYVLEYMDGGNYLTLLNRHGGKLNEEMARFYLGELVLAVNAVHSLGFVHRSVKPENILFDSLGHLKLSGFGSASRITKDGTVSSPLQVEEASYEAPEILRTLGNTDFIYGHLCDFWSIGVIAYETVFQEHPFKDTSSLATFKKITLPKPRESLEFPKKIKVSEDLKDFIAGLLVEQEERLDYDDILCHSFFATLIWDGIRNEVAVSIPHGVVEDMFGQTTSSEDAVNQTPVRNKSSLTHRPLSNVSYIGFTVNQETCPRSTQDHSSILDSTVGSINNEGCNNTNKDYSRLKSELEIKTESVKEKLNEIQMLQTQLQNTHGVLENKDSELAGLKGENHRLTLDMEQLKANLSEEKDAREQLEFKVQEVRMNCSFSVMNELKEEIRLLNDALSAKETEIHDLTAVVEELQQKVSKSDKEMHNSMKREAALEESFLQTQRGSISMIETRVTRNSSALEARIKDLENQLSQERQQRTRDIEQREAEVRELIQTKLDQISELQGRMEETRLSREASLEEIRQTRKKYGETIGQLQNSLERAIEDYLEMKERFEKEHDPTLQLQIEELEKQLEELAEDNGSLKLKLDDCEKTKLAEATKAQQLDDIVRQLSESVQSLQQQKSEIFESTKEFLRQNQNSEGLKGAQKVLEDQLTKMQETLDSTKEALYEEKQNIKEIANILQSSRKEVTDCQAVIRVLTVQKQEVEDNLKKVTEKCKETDLALSTLEFELKELKKLDSKQSIIIENLKSEVAEERKDLEETQKLLAETKLEKDRLEIEKADLTKDLEEIVQLKSRVSELESEIKEKDFKVEEKIQENESSKLKMDLLKESCSILENQLKSLETIISNKNEELEAALTKSTMWSDKLKTTEESLKEAKIAASEAKSLQIFAEKQFLSLKSHKDSEVESKTQLVSQLHEKSEELRKKYDEKLSELNAMAGKMEQLKHEKSVLDCMHEDLKRKQTQQSQEISRYLNSIVNMKEKMINLKTDLHEEMQKAEFYRDRAKIIIEEKELVEMDKTQRESELQATINQQVKLIQFFQSQAQQLSTKKKRFRFFGREKEAEHPNLQILDGMQASGSGGFTMPRTPAVTPSSAMKTPGLNLVNPKPIRKFQYEDDSDEEGTASATNTSTTSTANSS